MESTWATRDLPVLDAIVQFFDESSENHLVTVGELAVRLGRSAEEVFQACRALEGAFIEMSLVMAGGAVEPQMVVGISSSARREVGQWPSAEQYLDRLLAALEARAVLTEEGEERTKLRRAADAMRGITRDVAVGVATAALGGVVS